MASWKRPALCRICEGPVVDGGCRADQVDLKKLSEWWKIKLDTELDLDDVQNASFCHFCVWEASLEHEHTYLYGPAPECKYDWWTVYDSDDLHLKNLFKDDMIRPCRVKLEQNLICEALFPDKQFQSTGNHDANNIIQCPSCIYVCESNLLMDFHLRKVHKFLPKCSDCQIYFSNLAERDKHLDEVHAETPNNCIHCLHDIKKENSQLRQHLRKVHSDLKIWSCTNKKCMRQFFTELEVNNHFSRAHKLIGKLVYSCVYDDCKVSYSRTHHLVTHLQNKHDGIFFRCNFNEHCSSFFKNIEERVSHINGVHKKLSHDIVLPELNKHVNNHNYKKKIKCNYLKCHDVFNSEQEQQEHVIQVHWFKGKSVKTCRYCQMTIVNNNLNYHLRTHHKNESYSFCKNNYCGYYGSRQEMLDHIREKHELRTGSIKCVYCGLFYTTNAGLRNHVKLTHKSQAIKCTYICRQYFLTTAERDEHIAKVHLKAPIIRDYICIYCNECKLSRKNLVHHVITVHKHKYIKCTMYRCTKFFLSQSDLERHYQENHLEKEKGKKFMCSKCNYKTDNKRLLRDHLMRSHSTTKVTCPKCNTDFNSKLCLSYHLNRRCEKITCEHCKKIVTNIKLHKRWSECKYCQKVTRCFNLMRQHMQICTNKVLKSF